MMLTKIVNGQRMPLTDEEEAARLAEELEWQNRPPERPIPTEAEILRRALAEKGIVISDADLAAGARALKS